MALNFNKLKSFFVVTEEVDDSKNNTTEQQTNKENTTTKVETEKVEKKQETSKMSWKTTSGGDNKEIQEIENTVSVGITAENVDGVFSQKIFDQLTQAIFAANLPGEDYLEFMEALQAMKNIPLDENIKIQTVFATLSAKGLTKQKVVESADYYLKILENEKTKFYDVLNSHTKNQINSKHSEITQLETAVSDKEKQIIQLQEEIKQSKQVVLKIKNDIQQADGKIKKTENDFLITFNAIAQNIKKTIEKVKTI